MQSSTTKLFPTSMSAWVSIFLGERRGSSETRNESSHWFITSIINTIISYYLHGTKSYHPTSCHKFRKMHHWISFFPTWCGLAGRTFLALHTTFDTLASNVPGTFLPAPTLLKSLSVSHLLVFWYRLWFWYWWQSGSFFICEELWVESSDPRLLQCNFLFSSSFGPLLFAIFIFLFLQAHFFLIHRNCRWVEALKLSTLTSLRKLDSRTQKSSLLTIVVRLDCFFQKMRLVFCWVRFHFRNVWASNSHTSYWRIWKSLRSLAENRILISECSLISLNFLVFCSFLNWIGWFFFVRASLFY